MRPVMAVGAAPPGVQRQGSDVDIGRAQITAGRQRPKFAEGAAVSQAEKTRLSILDNAINQLGPLFEAMNRQRANEPMRAFQVPSPAADAMHVLGLNTARIDIDTAEGMGTLSYLYAAFLSLVRNRYFFFADIQIGTPKECYPARAYESSGTYCLMGRSSPW